MSANKAKLGRGKGYDIAPRPNLLKFTDLLSADANKHYVFHCNKSIGAIFGPDSETKCRAYILAHPTLILTSIIVDEEEYQLLKRMPDEQIRLYFEHLEELAKM